MRLFFLPRLFALAAGSAVMSVIVSCAPPSAVKAEPDKPNAIIDETKPAAQADKKAAADESNTRAWPTFFGSPSRNPVNLAEKSIATEWNIEEGSQKNIKWVQTCGSRSYAGPVMAGGRIFVGTNNE